MIKQTLQGYHSPCPGSYYGYSVYTQPGKEIWTRAHMKVENCLVSGDHVLIYM